MTDSNLGPLRLRLGRSVAFAAAAAALGVSACEPKEGRGSAAAESAEATPPPAQLRISSLPPRLPKLLKDLKNRELVALIEDPSDPAVFVAGLGQWDMDTQVINPGQGNQREVRIAVFGEMRSWKLDPTKASAHWGGSPYGFVLAALHNQDPTYEDAVFGIPKKSDVLWVVEKETNGGPQKDDVIAYFVVYDTTDANKDRGVKFKRVRSPGGGNDSPFRVCKHADDVPKHTKASARFQAWNTSCDDVTGNSTFAGPDSSGGDTSARFQTAGGRPGHGGGRPRVDPVALTAWVSCDLGCCTLGP